jgi:uncharacterized protein YciI
MKAFVLVLLFLLGSFLGSFPQQKKTSPPVIKYNAEKAKKLGADELGMRNYVIAFMRAGPVKLTSTHDLTVLRKAHLLNMQRLYDEGKLLLAGPFTDGKSMRGFYIFDVPSIEEARILTVSDPAVQAGTLIMELHTWYGTAALKEIPDLHKAIQKRGLLEDQ